jgi:hypothetical protein
MFTVTPRGRSICYRLLNDRLLRCHGDMWNGKIKRHDP